MKSERRTNLLYKWTAGRLCMGRISTEKRDQKDLEGESRRQVGILRKIRSVG